MKYSEHPDEAKKASTEYINGRWKDLSDLQQEAARAADAADAVLRFIQSKKVKGWIIGEVTKGTGRVRVTD